MPLRGFYGNEETIGVLFGKAAAVQLPHAVLICGERGNGKSFVARLLAQTLVCSGGADAQKGPCGACRDCLKSFEDSHPDIYFYRGSGATATIKVGQAREINAIINLMPGEAEVKVIVVEDAGRLTQEAANALLKAVEDPPPRTHFIFTAESPEELAPTLRSRLAAFTLRPPSPQDAARAVDGACGCGSEAAERAVALFDNNVGRSLEYLRDEKVRALYDAAAGFFAAAASLSRFEAAKSLTGLQNLSRVEISGIFDIIYEQAGRAILTRGARHGVCLDSRQAEMIGGEALGRICGAAKKSRELCAANSQLQTIFAFMASAV